MCVDHLPCVCALDWQAKKCKRAGDMCHGKECDPANKKYQRSLSELWNEPQWQRTFFSSRLWSGICRRSQWSASYVFDLQSIGLRVPVCFFNSE